MEDVSSWASRSLAYDPHVLNRPLPPVPTSPVATRMNERQRPYQPPRIGRAPPTYYPPLQRHREIFCWILILSILCLSLGALIAALILAVTSAQSDSASDQSTQARKIAAGVLGTLGFGGLTGSLVALFWLYRGTRRKRRWEKSAASRMRVSAEVCRPSLRSVRNGDPLHPDLERLTSARTHGLVAMEVLTRPRPRHSGYSETSRTDRAMINGSNRVLPRLDRQGQNEHDKEDNTAAATAPSRRVSRRTNSNHTKGKAAASRSSESTDFQDIDLAIEEDDLSHRLTVASDRDLQLHRHERRTTDSIRGPSRPRTPDSQAKHLQQVNSSLHRLDSISLQAQRHSPTISQRIRLDQYAARSRTADDAILGAAPFHAATSHDNSRHGDAGSTSMPRANQTMIPTNGEPWLHRSMSPNLEGLIAQVAADRDRNMRRLRKWKMERRFGWPETVPADDGELGRPNGTIR